MDIIAKLPQIKKNIRLAPYTTFKIGGPAQYFFIAKTNDDLIKAIKNAKEENLPYFILGGASNLLVSDQGFKGLVIKAENSNFEIKDSLIRAEAGAKLDDIVKASIKANLTGLEWAAGIPGTIGGAVKVNASAFGQSIKKSVKKIRKQGDVILSVELRLKKNGDKNSVKEHLDYRKKNHPKEPSAGCIFKNPPGHSAGQLIDEAGLKGRKIGGAMVSEKHANFIINTGQAKAEDVIILISIIKQKVRNKFGIQLMEEIKYLGF